MKQEPDYNQIAEYLAGESSDADLKAIKSRIKKDPEYARMVREFQKIWKTKKAESDNWDIEGVWERLNREISRDERIKSHQQPIAIRRANRKVTSVHRPKLRWSLHIAAVLAVIAFTSLFAVLNMSNGSQEEQTVMQEVATEPGQRATIRLSDGSHIRLNSGSTLRYQGNFNEEVRIVHLSGEAFFEISRNGKPFFVQTDDVQVEVLGTEFNVRAYEDDENIQVVVAGGKVAVRPGSQADDVKVHLERGDMATYYRENEDSISVNRGVDISAYIGWMEYRMTFDDTPMDSVARILERWYGVKIIFSDPTIAELNVSAIFVEESIHEVLRVINIALNLNHKIEGRSITLSRNETE